MIKNRFTLNFPWQFRTSFQVRQVSIINIWEKSNWRRWKKRRRKFWKELSRKCRGWILREFFQINRFNHFTTLENRMHQQLILNKTRSKIKIRTTNSTTTDNILKIWLTLRKYTQSKMWWPWWSQKMKPVCLSFTSMSRTVALRLLNLTYEN